MKEFYIPAYPLPMKANIWHIISATIFILLFLVAVSFAEIPIYCPKCKTHLYNYKYDEVIPDTVIYAKDFLPANETINQPEESEPMICPLCKVPLNGWEYWASLKKVKSVTFAYRAFSLLTKENGKWKWIPYEVADLENEVNTK